MSTTIILQSHAAATPVAGFASDTHMYLIGILQSSPVFGVHAFSGNSPSHMVAQTSKHYLTQTLYLQRKK